MEKMENLEFKCLVKVNIRRKYFLFLFVIEFLGYCIYDVQSLDFSIDNRLLVTPSDCYTRISIGSRLPDSLIISTFEANAAADCEAACSTNGTFCGSFSFGVGLKGNSTCMLGQGIPQNHDDLSENQEYDVYVKGQISLLGCIKRSGKTFKTILPSLKNQFNNQIDINSNNDTMTVMINSDTKKIFGNSSLLNFIENPIFTRNKNQSIVLDSNNNKNYTNNNNNNDNDNNNISVNNNNPNKSWISSRKLPKSSFLSHNDDQIRTLDILQNKQGPYHPHHHQSFQYDLQNYFPSLYYNFGTDDYQSEVRSIWPSVIKNEDKYTNYNSNNNKYHTKKNNNNNEEINYIFGQKIPSEVNENVFSSTLASNDFGHKLNNRPTFVFDTNYENLWLGSGTGGQFLLEDAESTENHKSIGVESLKGEKACFRRLVSGKRIVNAYVRRTIECDRLQDCYRMCEYERGFTCEGFNYRTQTSSSKSMCDLTSTPPNRMNMHRDFTVDHQCDFYERDWTHSCFHKHTPKDRIPTQNWWASNQRPGWTDGRQRHQERKEPQPLPAPPSSVLAPYGGSFKENTQLTIDLPRPIDSNRKRPIALTPNTGSLHPVDAWNRPKDQPLPVRPLESYYPGYGDRRPPTGTRDEFYHYNRIPIDGNKRPYLPAKSGGDDDNVIYNGNGYSYGRPIINRWQGSNYYHGYTDRRVGYGSDPALNEIAPYPPDYRKPSKPWTYADAYHTHYIGDYRPQVPPINDREPPPYSIRLPNDRDHFLGQVYNYGGAYGYSNNPLIPSKIPPPVPGSQRCSIRSAGGFKLAKGIIRKSYLTPNIEQCEHLCDEQKEFNCLTYAYRYSIAPTSPSDNCFLSNIPLENLVFYTDLEPDRDYDVYAMMDGKWCEARMRPPYLPIRPHPPDECFWRVRSGFTMPSTAIKQSVRVDGMGECQIQCVRSKDFTCRSFVYKYEGYPVHGLPNCFVSDWPAMEVNPDHMQDMDGAELYERGSFGRGCEPRLPAPVPPTPDYRKPPRPDDASCYTGYDRPCKLMPYAIILACRVESEAECRHKCSAMRQRDLTPCMSFSFKTDGDHRGDNCYLSDIPTRDLRPGLDYIYDDDYTLYVWKELEPKCLSHPNYYDDKPSYYPLSYPSYPTGSGEHYPSLEKPPIKPEDPYYYTITIPDPNKPAVPSDPGSLGPPYDTGYSGQPGYPGPLLEYGVDEKFFFPTVPDEFSVFRQFTVNGFPCKRGTRCERNRVAGFWSCEPEGSEPGAWDYCCEPNHQCGFSQGHNYPWCYVGPSRDQWRPCNEKYFPYQFPPRPIVRPHNRVSSPRLNNCDVICQGRHWPITFLHSEAPPNSTDSVALANDYADHTTAESSTFKLMTESSTNQFTALTEFDNENTSMSIENAPNMSTISSESRLMDSNDFSVYSNGNLTRKRGIRLPPGLFLKAKRTLNGLPLRTIRNRSNRTSDRYYNYRINHLNLSRKMEPRKNDSIEFSPEFSKDENTGQYYITKKINTGVATQTNMQSNNSNNNNNNNNNNTSDSNKETTKISMAKIEKISRSDLDNKIKTTQKPQFVSIVSSKEPTSMASSLKVTTPIIRVVTTNSSSSSVDTRHWERVTTIDKVDE